ncbi:MAG: class I SAM-dependent methyltransferase [Bdellovibrionota bacterium]|nr:class I SAM-dependent methyltransferase [Bdellovibrionota bacterium]
MRSFSFYQIQKIVNSIDGWLNPPVVSLLYRLAKRLPDNPMIVEIGSWKGKSTVLLQLSRPDARVFAIDPFTGSHEHEEEFGEVDTYEDFIKNINTFCDSSQISVIRNLSANAVNELPDGIDMLWIDGSHDYRDVKSDFELYYPKLKEGAWVAMHDYKWQGVKQFTWELLKSDFDISSLRRVEDTHYFRKKKSNFISRKRNLVRLQFYESLQFLKRNRRKFKKKIKAKFKN